MKKLSVVSLLSIVLIANAAGAKAGTAEEWAKLIKSGKMSLEPIDAVADKALEEAEAAGQQTPPPPPPRGPKMAVPAAPQMQGLYDSLKKFECSKADLDASGKVRLFDSKGKQVAEGGEPRFIKFPADYKGCVFDGTMGERWHALFPGHPASSDNTCEIAWANQQNGDCINCFPTPKTCVGENSVASLPSANVRATVDATPQEPYTDVPPSLSYAARVELIKRAKKSIRIQYLIFYGDESGWELAKLLIKKKKEIPSIDIRVNVDAASSFQPGFIVTTQDMYFDLKQHGIPVEGYEFAGLAWVNELNLKNPLAIDKRWHDKIFAVDAEDPDNAYAVVGGQNIANEYFRIGFKKVEIGKDKTENIWRDQDVVVHGPIVRDIAKSFDNNFDHFKRVKKANGKFNTDDYWTSFMNLVNKIDPSSNERPEVSKDWKAALPEYTPKAALVNTFVLGKNPIWVKEPAPAGVNHPVFRLKLRQPNPDRDTVKQVRALSDSVDPTHVCSPSELSALDKGTLGHGCSVLAQLKLEPSTMRWFNNHPRYDETYIMQAYGDLVRNAKESIVISNAYFIPSAAELDRPFVVGLKEAANRCVAVTILTNAAEASDGPDVEVAGRSMYQDLMTVNTPALVKKCGSAPMKIYEWEGHKFDEYTNHAKFAVFDQKDVVVGSFNLDPRSAHLNSETILVFENKVVATQMYNQVIRYDIGKKSTLVTPTMAEEYAHPTGFRARFGLQKALSILKEL